MRKGIVLVGILTFDPGPKRTGPGRERNQDRGHLSPSGPMAGTGQMLRNGVLMAIDIINNKHDFDFIFADTEGLPNLGGAKIEVIFADSAGDPKTGMSEAERLITSEGVVALVGCYQSSVTKTASQVAERYGIPLTSTATLPPLN